MDINWKGVNMVGVSKTRKLFPHNVPVLLILISQYFMGGFNEIKTSKVKRKWFHVYPCSIYYTNLHNLWKQIKTLSRVICLDHGILALIELSRQTTVMHVM